MKEMHEIRRKNVARLVDHYTTQQALADALQTSPGYIYQIVSGYRNVGERSARNIEASTGMPEGWLDQPHPPDTSADQPAATSRPIKEDPDAYSSALIALATLALAVDRASPGIRDQIHSLIGAYLSKPKNRDKLGRAIAQLINGS
jgi:hypothetical protein